MSTRTWPIFYRGYSRGLSLLLTIPLCLMLLVHPQLLVDQQQYSHPQLLLMILGMMAGFIHGVGFVPYNRFARLLFNPVLGWGLLLLGYCLIYPAL